MPTQAQPTAYNTLCPLPDYSTETAAQAAFDRGVPYFMWDVLTDDYLPNHGNSRSK